MNELSYEDWILGGSASDAILSIRKIDEPEKLESLLRYEKRRMKRKSVIKGLENRLKKLRSKVS